MHALLAALADPVRFEIVELLATGDRTVGEIAERFPVSGPAISRHLRVLREAGLATYRHDAQRRVYRLEPAAFEQLGTWTTQLERAWRTRFDALGQHLDHKKGRS